MKVNIQPPTPETRTRFRNMTDKQLTAYINQMYGSTGTEKEYYDMAKEVKQERKAQTTIF